MAAPARLAWTRLRRDLEAAADDEAAAAVGTAPLLSALAKVALATAAAPAAASPARPAFADPGDLRYRVRRLQQPRTPGASARLILRLAGALLIFALASAACQALHASAEWSGLVPAWRLRLPGLAADLARRPPVPRHGPLTAPRTRTHATAQA